MGMETSTAMKPDAEQGKQQQLKAPNLEQLQQQDLETMQQHKDSQIVQDQITSGTCQQLAKQHHQPQQEIDQTHQQQLLSLQITASAGRQTQQHVTVQLVGIQQLQETQPTPSDLKTSQQQQQQQQQLDMQDANSALDSTEHQKKKIKRHKSESFCSELLHRPFDSFQINVVDSITAAPVVMLVNNTTTMKCVLEDYCSKQGFSTTERKLSFNGVLVDPDGKHKTVRDLRLKDQDTLSAVPFQCSALLTTAAATAGAAAAGAAAAGAGKGGGTTGGSNTSPPTSGVDADGWPCLHSVVMNFIDTAPSVAPPVSPLAAAAEAAEAAAAEAAEAAAAAAAAAKKKAAGGAQKESKGDGRSSRKNGSSSKDGSQQQQQGVVESSSSSQQQQQQQQDDRGDRKAVENSPEVTDLAAVTAATGVCRSSSSTGAGKQQQQQGGDAGTSSSNSTSAAGDNVNVAALESTTAAAAANVSDKGSKNDDEITDSCWRHVGVEWQEVDVLTESDDGDRDCSSSCTDTNNADTNHCAPEETFKILLDKFCEFGDVNVRGPQGLTALHLACGGHYEDKHKSVLLKPGVTLIEQLTVFKQVGYGVGSASIVHQLIAAGADVTAKSDKGITPLLAAVCAGNHQAAALIIDHHRATAAAAAAAAAGSSEGDSSTSAAAAGSSDKVLWGTDVAGNKPDLLPLHQAIVYGHTKCIRVLVAARVDLNYRCSYGYTPLLQCVVLKRLLLASILISAGARAGTPALACDDVELHYAALNKEWTAELVKQVVSAGCPLNSFNGVKGGGCTPLVLAASKGNLLVVKALISAGADVDLPDKASAMTPLHYAALGGYLEIANALIAAGASLELVDSYDMTPVQVGAQYGQLEVVVRLIESGAKWPRGKGAKAAGGDVVTMLADSRKVQQRNLKASWITVKLTQAEKRYWKSKSSNSSSSDVRSAAAAPQSPSGTAAAAAAAAVRSSSGALLQSIGEEDDIEALVARIEAGSSSSSSSNPSSSKKQKGSKKNKSGSAAAAAAAAVAGDSANVLDDKPQLDMVVVKNSKVTGSSPFALAAFESGMMSSPNKAAAAPATTAGALLSGSSSSSSQTKQACIDELLLLAAAKTAAAAGKPAAFLKGLTDLQKEVLSVAPSLSIREALQQQQQQHQQQGLGQQLSRSEASKAFLEVLSEQALAYTNRSKLDIEECSNIVNTAAAAVAAGVKSPLKNHPAKLRYTSVMLHFLSLLMTACEGSGDDGVISNDLLDATAVLLELPVAEVGSSSGSSSDVSQLFVKSSSKVADSNSSISSDGRQYKAGPQQQQQQQQQRQQQQQHVESEESSAASCKEGHTDAAARALAAAEAAVKLSSAELAQQQLIVLSKYKLAAAAAAGGINGTGKAAAAAVEDQSMLDLFNSIISTLKGELPRSIRSDDLSDVESAAAIKHVLRQVKTLAQQRMKAKAKTQKDKQQQQRVQQLVTMLAAAVAKNAPVEVLEAAAVLLGVSGPAAAAAASVPTAAAAAAAAGGVADKVSSKGHKVKMGKPVKLSLAAAAAAANVNASSSQAGSSRAGSSSSSSSSWAAVAGGKTIESSAPTSSSSSPSSAAAAAAAATAAMKAPVSVATVNSQQTMIHESVDVDDDGDWKTVNSKKGKQIEKKQQQQQQQQENNDKKSKQPSGTAMLTVDDGKAVSRNQQQQQVSTSSAAAKPNPGKQQQQQQPVVSTAAAAAKVAAAAAASPCSVSASGKSVAAATPAKDVKPTAKQLKKAEKSPAMLEAAAAAAETTAAAAVTVAPPLPPSTPTADAQRPAAVCSPTAAAAAAGADTAAAASSSVNSSSSGHCSVFDLLAADEWCYEDPYGYVQGPFPINDIFTWFEAGFFTVELPIRPGITSGQITKSGSAVGTCDPETVNFTAVADAGVGSSQGSHEVAGHNIHNDKELSWSTLGEVIRAWAAYSLLQFDSGGSSSSSSSDTKLHILQQLQKWLPSDWCGSADAAAYSSSGLQQQQQQSSGCIASSSSKRQLNVLAPVFQPDKEMATTAAAEAKAQTATRQMHNDSSSSSSGWFTVSLYPERAALPPWLRSGVPAAAAAAVATYTFDDARSWQSACDQAKSSSSKRGSIAGPSSAASAAVAGGCQLSDCDWSSSSSYYSCSSSVSSIKTVAREHEHATQHQQRQQQQQEAVASDDDVNRQDQQGGKHGWCLMCSGAAASVLLLPCKHMVLCRDCFDELPVGGSGSQAGGKRCPKAGCGAKVDKHVVVHRS